MIRRKVFHTYWSPMVEEEKDVQTWKGIWSLTTERRKIKRRMTKDEVYNDFLVFASQMDDENRLVNLTEYSELIQDGGLRQWTTVFVVYYREE